MNITLFEDAIALIEEGSMRSAAHRRNVTQPAFSRRIKTLEAWLGVELVERHANPVNRSISDPARSELEVRFHFRHRANIILLRYIIGHEEG